MNTPYHALSTVLADMKRLKSARRQERNFFDVGGSGYLENPTSDLMALFMGGQPGVPPWLAKALIRCLGVEIGPVDWGAVRAEREVSFSVSGKESKRLDIVFGDSSFIVGIENKVWAGASHNPFQVYDALLESRFPDGPVFRCVLRPVARLDDVPKNWPVVTYQQLVRQALNDLGQEMMADPFSKWQVFYREFLGHLTELSAPPGSQIMNQDSEKFVLENYDQLLDAAKLLELFCNKLQKEAEAAIVQSLSRNGDEISLRLGIANWQDRKALRFLPKHWGGDSQVVLMYFEDAEYGEDGKIGYGLRAYIDRRQVGDLETLKQLFDDPRNAQLPPSVYPSERTSWYENNERLLVLDLWPKVYSKAGAITGIADLAAWLDRAAFSG